MPDNLEKYTHFLDKIIHSIRQYDCILWAGSGLSLYDDFPSTKTLVKNIIDSLCEDDRKYFNYDNPLDLVSEEYCKIKSSRDPLIKILNDFFLREPNKTHIHEIIYNIPQIEKIITTNYDRFFEFVYADDIIKVVTEEDLPLTNEFNKAILYKIHGDILIPDSIIITKSDYIPLTNNQKNNLIFNEVISHSLKNTILFIGYSVDDVDILSTFDFIKSKIGSPFKEGYLVAPNWADHNIKDLKTKYNIEYINSDSEPVLKYIYQGIENSLFSDLSTYTLHNNDRTRKILSKRGIRTNSSISPSDSFGNIQLQFQSKNMGNIDVNGNTIASFSQINQKMGEMPVEDVKVTITSIDGQYQTPLSLGEGIFSIQEVTKSLNPDQSCKFVQKSSGKIIDSIKRSQIITKDGPGLFFEHTQFTFKMLFPKKKRLNGKFHIQIEDSSDIFMTEKIYSFFNDLITKKDSLIIFLDSTNYAIDIPSEAINSNIKENKFIAVKSKIFSDLAFIQRMVPLKFRTSKFKRNGELEILKDIIDTINGSKRPINSIDADIEIKEHQLFKEYLEKDIPVMKLVPEKKEVAFLGEIFTYQEIIFGYNMFFDNLSEVIIKEKNAENPIQVVCKSRSDDLYIHFSKLEHIGSIIDI